MISVNQGYGPKNGLFPSDRSWSVLYSVSQLNCVLWPDDIVCGLVSFYICDPKPAAVPQRSLQVHSTSLSSYSSTPLTMPHLLFSYQIHSTSPPHLHPSLTAFHLKLLRAEKCSEGKVTSNFLSMSLPFIRDDFLYNLLEDLHLHCAFDPMSLLSPQGHCSGSFFSLFYLQHQIFLFDWIILVSMHTHTALHMILNKKIKQTRTSKKKKKVISIFWY